MKLTNLKIGEYFKIDQIGELSDALSSKLDVFGFSKGDTGFIKRMAPFGGPIEIDINGSPISIRCSDAEHISVLKL